MAMHQVQRPLLFYLEQITHKISQWMEVVGTVAIFGIVLFPCVDVVGGKIFSRPLPGSYELVVFCQLLAIPFAVAASLLKGKHIAVDLFVNILPLRVRALINCFVAVLGLSLFSAICWQAFLYGNSLRAAQEVSGTIEVPLYPFAYSLSLSCIPVCLIFIITFWISLKKLFKTPAMF
jgi:TRAP-type C4-dicarboxylate transport system permease small subunit